MRNGSNTDGVGGEDGGREPPLVLGLEMGQDGQYEYFGAH